MFHILPGVCRPKETARGRGVSSTAAGPSARACTATVHMQAARGSLLRSKGARFALASSLPHAPFSCGVRLNHVKGLTWEATWWMYGMCDGTAKLAFRFHMPRTRCYWVDDLSHSTTATTPSGHMVARSCTLVRYRIFSTPDDSRPPSEIKP